MREKFGEQFLHQKESKLHTSDLVEHEMERKKGKGEKVSQKPADKIADWLKVIERTHLGHRDDPRVLERIKDYYHKKYVIRQEDIPESYFNNRKRLAREQGRGDIEITDEIRSQSSEVIISDQKSTLDNWIEYFNTTDSKSCPTWAKYWAFTNMLKLSTYDKEKHAFAKRDKDTVAPFPDLNRESLAYVIDIIVKKANKEGIQSTEYNPELKKLIEGANFGKLYAYAIEKVTPTEENELLNTNGEWIKYPQNSDHMPLVRSLQGYGTGWCTAGESTAQAQLEDGDFYVYYSYGKDDKQGHPTIPRVAIRMGGSQIAEVRGIAPEQNLDPHIGDIVNKKLAGFPDGKAYQKKSADMKRLTEMDKKNSAGEDLTIDDLRFLYEINSKIEGFGYKADPRIEEVKEKRDVKSDLSLITGYSRQQISTTKEQALRGEIKFHYGNLYLGGVRSAQGLKLPETVNGFLYLNDLQSAEGLKLPETVNGHLDLSGLQSAQGLKLSETVNGNLYLGGLQSAEGLELPETIKGGLDLKGLQSAEGLILPKTIKGSLNLRSLKSAEGLKLPETLKGDLYLNDLQSAEGLELPETVNGHLDLGGLQSAKGLKLPETVNGYLYLRSLQSAEGLMLPKTINGGLDLSRLQSAKGLKLPETIKGAIDLSDLQSAEGLELPETVNGGLYLNGLRSAEGLKLPKTIKGGLYLKGLQSAEGLILPETVNSDLDLSSLRSAEKEKLRAKYPKLIIRY